MRRKIIIALGGLLIGGISAYLFLLITPQINRQENLISVLEENLLSKQVIGFLPYWLLSKAKVDYNGTITSLTYFGLTIDTNGTILKKISPQESEPGWYALDSGKVDSFLNAARDHNQALSLLMFNGDEASISALLDDPVSHGKNLVRAVAPLMKERHFTNLNIDIESTRIASEESRIRFTNFLETVKKEMKDNNLGSLTVDVTSDSFIQKKLIDPTAIKDIADYLVIMAYDYHFQGSLVTGPVAPLLGGGIDLEYDVDKAVNLALQNIPAEKIILGVPLYGYEWETIRSFPHSATIPSSGLTASTMRVENLLAECATCSAQWDNEAKEQYVIYSDPLGSYHQIYFPDKKSMQEKITYAKDKKLAGLALWALGYEDTSILEPLHSYK